MAGEWGAPSKGEAQEREGWVALLLGIGIFGILGFIFTVGIPPGCDNEDPTLPQCTVSPLPALRRYIGTYLIGSREPSGNETEAGVGEVDLMTLLTDPSKYAQQAAAMWREPEEKTPLITETPYVAVELSQIELSENSQTAGRAELHGIYAKFRIKNSGDSDINKLADQFPVAGKIYHAIVFCTPANLAFALPGNAIHQYTLCGANHLLVY